MIDSPSPARGSVFERTQPHTWVQTTARLMYDSIRCCVERAIRTDPTVTSPSAGVVITDEVICQLHACTQACARALYAIGQTEDAVVATIRAGAEAAAAPGQLHPAVFGALEDWTRAAAARS